MSAVPAPLPHEPETAPAAETPELAEAPVAAELPSTVVSAVTPAIAPAAAPAMSMAQHRDAVFRDRVVARLREQPETAPEAVFAALAAEQRALAAAITDSAFIDAAGQHYLAARSKENSDPAIVTTPETARLTLEQIVHRRAHETRGYAELLAQPEFQAQMQAAAADPQSPAFATADVRQVKLQETIEELLHRNAEGVPEVQAHIDAARKGTYDIHHALAETYHAAGPLQAELVASLARHGEGTDAARHAAIAAGWLADREGPAAETTRLIANDGEAYLQASAISQQYHGERLGLVAAPAPTYAQQLQADRAATAASAIEL